MPNSINRFPVLSTNNKTEDQWFMVSLIAIVLISTALLFWQNHDKAKPLKLLPSEINPIVNQLSNAADEIAFLIEAELLPNEPTLVALQASFVSPFDTQAFISPAAGCFVTEVTNFEVALSLSTSGQKLAWRPKHDEHVEHTHQADIDPSIDSHCLQANQGWQKITSNASADSHSSHDSSSQH